MSGESHAAATTRLRGFWSLIATQFQGTFSDNAFKNLVIYLIVGMGLSQQERDRMVPIVGALFGIPFLLFSMWGGFLADRFSKRSVTIWLKVLEIAAMALALAGLALGEMHFLFAVVFLMSTQSALFGPSKYGLLPELLRREKLSWGNGILELTTFVSIILGTVAGAWMSGISRDTQYWSGFTLVGLSMLGLMTSFGVTRVPAADPGKAFRVNFVHEVWHQVSATRRDRVLFLAILGNAYFWFLGALLQPLIVIYASDLLGATQAESGYLQASLALGIGIGSLVAGYLSGQKVEYGLIPLGAIGLTIFAVSLAQPGLSYLSVLARISILGFFGGFVAVPINALIQHRPTEEEKGSVIAAASFISWIGIALASGFYFVLTVPLGWSPRIIFLFAGTLTLAGTVYACILLPRSLLRFTLWLLTQTLYRVRVTGREYVPSRGGTLLVSNHLSFVDALLLMASTDRSVRFLMHQEYYDHPWIGPLARVMGALPISSQQKPRELIRSLRKASDVIREGGVVCIFAEGQITRIGQLLPFRRGFERIMKGVDAPIIPVCLEGVWGSIFSFDKGSFVAKWPRRIPYPVVVSYGRPMPPASTAFELRQAVQELQSESYHLRKSRMRPIHRAFVESARRHPLRFAMADYTRPPLRSGRALSGAVFLARRLRSACEDAEMIGLLLPPSVAGALANFAVLLLGKIPVNLNYSASDAVLASCAEQCKLKTVITSKAFLERLKLHVPGRAVYLEEVAARPRISEQLGSLLISRLLPIPLLEQSLGVRKKPQVDDLATVIFSSGSTGEPKGVMLTHYNVLSNTEQIQQIFPLDRRDRLLGILPFFHSFGFTATLIFPALVGLGAVYHPSPLDVRGIGEVTRRFAVTFMMATPTFLQLYTRRCAPEDFGSLRYVLVGAEKLPERIARGFEDRFGIVPFEGYGCTECSPVVSVNTRDYRAAGFRQVGAKRGTIGHPLPGISIRIVDPDTFAPLPQGKPGLMLVRGPNVMKGYLGRPEKTGEVLRDGWYDTGDIAQMDEDGFITITDRLSRFSKIGGEMVPHIKIEDKLHEAAASSEQTFVVAGVPDAKKGERLVVLHTLPEEHLRPVIDKLLQLDLPNLWIPRPDHFFRIEAIPLLGTGKVDLKKVRDLAVAMAEAI